MAVLLLLSYQGRLRGVGALSLPWFFFREFNQLINRSVRIDGTKKEKKLALASMGIEGHFQGKNGMGW